MIIATSGADNGFREARRATLFESFDLRGCITQSHHKHLEMRKTQYVNVFVQRFRSLAMRGMTIIMEKVREREKRTKTQAIIPKQKSPPTVNLNTIDI